MNIWLIFNNLYLYLLVFMFSNHNSLVKLLIDSVVSIIYTCNIVFFTMDVEISYHLNRLILMLKHVYGH
jgi:hypothetical protein